VVEYARLPAFPGTDARQVLAGGDDYELVFTARQERRAEIDSLSRDLKLALARVGSIQKGAAVLQVLDAERRAMPLERGFDHFAP
jgi:thiamine-monophosphate kinase